MTARFPRKNFQVRVTCVFSFWLLQPLNEAVCATEEIFSFQTFCSMINDTMAWICNAQTVLCKTFCVFRSSWQGMLIIVLVWANNQNRDHQNQSDTSPLHPSTSPMTCLYFPSTFFLQKCFVSIVIHRTAVFVFHQENSQPHHWSALE